MGEEMDVLISSLRERANNAEQEGNMTAECDAWYFRQSADTIDFLRAQNAERAAEIERLKEERDKAISDNHYAGAGFVLYTDHCASLAGYQKRAEAAEARCAELCQPFVNADEEDWSFILDFLPDDGPGRFWKCVLIGVRAALGAKP